MGFARNISHCLPRQLVELLESQDGAFQNVKHSAKPMLAYKQLHERFD
jgi:hypothetical protein